MPTIKIFLSELYRIDPAIERLFQYAKQIATLRLVSIRD